MDWARGANREKKALLYSWMEGKKNSSLRSDVILRPARIGTAVIKAGKSSKE